MTRHRWQPGRGYFEEPALDVPRDRGRLILAAALGLMAAALFLFFFVCAANRG
jgi:hypothetical protein